MALTGKFKKKTLLQYWTKTTGHRYENQVPNKYLFLTSIF